MCQIMTTEAAIKKIGEDNFFAAGIYIDSEDKVLLVRDHDPERATQIVNKLPGGVSQQYVYHDKIFLGVVDKFLEYYYYTGEMRSKILEWLEKERLCSLEMGMIAEFLEETGCLPASYKKDLVHQEISSKKNAALKFHQTFFWIDKLITNTSLEIEDYKEPEVTEGFNSIEKSIKGICMVKIKDYAKELFYNHQKPFQVWFQSQAIDASFYQKYSYMV